MTSAAVRNLKIAPRIDSTIHAASAIPMIFSTMVVVPPPAPPSDERGGPRSSRARPRTTLLPAGLHARPSDQRLVQQRQLPDRGEGDDGRVLHREQDGPVRRSRGG